MSLLNSQLKLFVQMATEKSFNWNDFSIEDNPNRSILDSDITYRTVGGSNPIMVKLQHQIIVRYKDTGFFFEINHNDPDFKDKVNYKIKYSPSTNSITSTNFDLDAFNLVGYKFKDWLNCLTTELDSLTFLENVKSNPTGNVLGLNLDFDYDDQSKFSAEEQKLIEQKLNEFRKELTAIPGIQENIQQINKKLDYIIERSQKVSRIDWVNLAASTFVSIAYDVATDPVKSAAVILTIKKLWENIGPVMTTLKLLG